MQPRLCVCENRRSRSSARAMETRSPAAIEHRVGIESVHSRRSQRESVNFSIDDQCGDRRISSSGLCGGASLCGVTLMTSRGCMRCPVSLSRKPRMTLPDLSMMTPSALTTVTTSTFTVAADARPFLAAIRELTGRALRRAVFLKVPCDRPTFAATRGYCIPPRGPWRACVRNQRARARGMRRLGRDGRVIRRFVALS